MIGLRESVTVKEHASSIAYIIKPFHGIYIVVFVVSRVLISSL